MMSTLHVRLDEVRKRKAQKILAGLGLDLSQVIRLFLHQICSTGGVPLNFLTENGFSVEEEKALLHDVREARRGRGVERYANVDDLLRSAYATAHDRH